MEEAKESSHRHLEGKISVVTGSGRGIGKAIALRLARAGSSVVVMDETDQAPSLFGESDSLEAVAEEVRQHGVTALFFFGDLRVPSICQQIVRSVLERMGRIDILVNNAGGDIGAKGNKPQPNDLFIDEADFEAVIGRNLMTTWNMCRAVVPVMQQQGYGRIVNIASVAAFAATGQEIAYSVAKAAVVHLTRCLAASLRPYGITVNAVAPGNTLSGRFLATLKERGLTENDIRPKGPLLRFSTPDDIARVVEFFVSPWADYVTGQVLVADAGAFSLQWTVR
ncbi:MAG: SDR family oxidoreductase [Armatimonadetes bacterium]|nr:SDR family oxidoreductase [Armatimonadota bacterium]MDW8120997.1 SDR family oxidoreductase [Armatimonadota bacterium]